MPDINYEEVAGYRHASSEQTAVSDFLIEDGDLEPREEKDLSRKGWVRTLLVGGSLGGVVIITLTFWWMFNSASQVTQKPSSQNPTEQSVEENRSDNETSDYKQELDRLKAERALGEQKELIKKETESSDRESEGKPQPKPNPQPIIKEVPSEPKVKPQPKPQPKAESPLPPPQVSAEGSPSPSEPSVDPVARWKTLAQSGQKQGSGFYQIQKPEIISESTQKPVASPPSKPPTPLESNSSGNAGVHSAPETQSPASSHRIPRHRIVLNEESSSASDLTVGERGIVNGQPNSSATLVQTSQGEAGILQQKPSSRVSEEETTVKQVPIGSSFQGEVVVPMVWSPSAPTPTDGRYVVALKEPVTSLQGKVLIPSGAMLVTEVRSLGKSGGIRQDVVAMVYETEEGKQQLEIPAGSLQVRGTGNLPLIAEEVGGRGSAITKQEALIGVLSALGQVGEVLNQPEAEVTVNTDDDLAVEQTTRNEPDLLGAALQGFFQPLSETLQERSRQEIQSAIGSQGSNIYVVERGTSVSVFVNDFLEVQL